MQNFQLSSVEYRQNKFACPAGFLLRLPTIDEWKALVDTSQINPALPSGHPFTDVKAGYYWSSTTYAPNSSFAWGVILTSALVSNFNKTYDGYVWPVRNA